MFLGVWFLGWIVLAVAYLPVAAILIWIASKRGVRNSAFVVTALALSLPYAAAIAEAAYVEHNWRALCETAKTFEKQRVVVEGFYESRAMDRHSAELRYTQTPNGFQHGLRFVEWRDKEGSFWRTDQLTEPKLRTAPIDKPTARYHVHTMDFATPISHLIRKNVSSIIDSEKGEVIAQKTIGLRDAAYIDRLWLNLFGNSPTICEDKSVIWGNTLVGIDRKADNK